MQVGGEVGLHGVQDRVTAGAIDGNDAVEMTFVFAGRKKICQRALVERLAGTGRDGFEPFDVFTQASVAENESDTETRHQ